VVVYAIHPDDFAPLLEKYPRAAQYVAAYSAVTADYSAPGESLRPDQMFMADLVRGSAPLCCPASATVQDAAALLSSRRAQSAVNTRRQQTFGDAHGSGSGELDRGRCRRPAAALQQSRETCWNCAAEGPRQRLCACDEKGQGRTTDTHQRRDHPECSEGTVSCPAQPVLQVHHHRSARGIRCRTGLFRTPPLGQSLPGS
jgi:hypothetical protein